MVHKYILYCEQLNTLHYMKKCTYGTCRNFDDTHSLHILMWWQVVNFEDNLRLCHNYGAYLQPEVLNEHG